MMRFQGICGNALLRVLGKVGAKRSSVLEDAEEMPLPHRVAKTNICPQIAGTVC